jgi:hypothetical protein
MTEMTNNRLLEKAKGLAAAANAATGSKDFHAGMLSVYSSIENNHGQLVVVWTATMGQFSSNGESETLERALDALENRISRYASVQANA